MNRRHLLRTALALTVVGPAWPARSSRPSLRWLRDEAAAEGRGLLIALVPAVDRQERARRGHLWGELLTHAGDVDLADLYVVRCAAATSAEFGLADDAFAALYAPGASAPCVLPHASLPRRVRDATLSQLGGARSGDRGLGGPPVPGSRRSAERARELAEWLRGFLHPSKASLEARRTDLEAALAACPRLATLPRTRALRRLVEALLRREPSGRNEPLRRAVGAVAHNEGRPPTFSGASLEAVGGTSPAPGPHGCAGVPCGSAHVPAASRRFLRFYLRDDD